jgi:hypothetical protein
VADHAICRRPAAWWPSFDSMLGCLQPSRPDLAGEGDPVKCPDAETVSACSSDITPVAACLLTPIRTNFRGAGSVTLTMSPPAPSLIPPARDLNERAEILVAEAPGTVDQD